MRCYLNILFLTFSDYFRIFTVTYISSFLKLLLSVRTLATTDVKLYHRTNAPTSEVFAAKTSIEFPFSSILFFHFFFVEEIKSRNLFKLYKYIQIHTNYSFADLSDIYIYIYIYIYILYIILYIYIYI